MTGPTCLQSIPKGRRIAFVGMLQPAEFVRRVNRFVAEVLVDGTLLCVHVPNTGRLPDLAVVGNPVWLLDRRSPSRKTDYDLLLCQVPDSSQWALVDSHWPMRILAHSLANGDLVELADVKHLRQEITYRRSRFDFAGRSGAGEIPTRIELKTVTHAVATPARCQARFPDAPTARGTRHLQELRQAVTEGARGVLIFIVCRPDVEWMAPNMEMDPAFASALWHAYETGVEVYAFRLDVQLEGCRLEERLPVRISRPR